MNPDFSDFSLPDDSLNMADTFDPMDNQSDLFGHDTLQDSSLTDFSQPDYSSFTDTASPLDNLPDSTVHDGINAMLDTAQPDFFADPQHDMSHHLSLHSAPDVNVHVYHHLYQYQPVGLNACNTSSPLDTGLPSGGNSSATDDSCGDGGSGSCDSSSDS